MTVLKRTATGAWVYITLICVTMICVTTALAAQSPDERAAERVLGPRWKQVSRAAGMIFSGTLISVEQQPPAQGRPVPSIQAKFRVDRGIAGARSGEFVTIREWAALLPAQRPLRSGHRMLLFFYPPSSAGFTSPIGGPLGQIPLDPNGNVVANDAIANDGNHAWRSRGGGQSLSVISFSQLERAIRSARGEMQ